MYQHADSSGGSQGVCLETRTSGVIPGLLGNVEVCVLTNSGMQTGHSKQWSQSLRVALGTVVVNPSNSYCVAHFMINQDYESPGDFWTPSKNGRVDWLIDREFSFSEVGNSHSEFRDECRSGWVGHRNSQNDGWVSGSATNPDFGRVGRWVVTVAGRLSVPTRQKNATLTDARRRARATRGGSRRVGIHGSYVATVIDGSPGHRSSVRAAAQVHNLLWGGRRCVGEGWG